MNKQETTERLEQIVHDLIVLFKKGKFDRGTLEYLNRIAKKVVSETEEKLKKEEV
jgi:hypothetical protein